MKVAIVCPYAWDRPGGVQTHVRSLATALRARGHAVVVLAPGHDRGALSDGVVIVSRAVAIPANGSMAPISFGPRAAVEVRRALDDADADVVHLHEPLIPSLSLLALWALGKGRPIVGTFHASAVRSIAYRMGKPVLERAARRLTVRTAVSDAARELVARYLPGTYHLTPNGVDPQTFADAVPADLGPGKKVLFLGRMEPRKGLEVLIHAFTYLRDLECELIVAGAGPQEIAARRSADSLQVPVRFVGPVDEMTKATLFKRADVYCAPALGGESFGIVLLEAMAAGTPVVCSNLPGFRDVALDAALFAPPGEAHALAEELRRVLTDGELVSRLSGAGKRTARAFGWDRLVGNVENIYERAIRESVHVQH